MSESATTVAFLDIFPLSPGHTLVIPKHHSQKLHDLPPAAVSDLSAELIKVAGAVVKATGVEDYNILQNNGEPAHQVVKHVHFHIIPKPDEKRGLGIKWPSGKADEKELDDMLAKVLEAQK